MKVSVIIPAYNEEKYIGRCLDSLNGQTLKPFEVIVVDNNSTDKTAEIVRQKGAKVVKEKKQGMIHARNKGFNEAKGEIIARTDADTVVSPTWIEKMSERFNADPKLDALSGPATYGSRILNPVFKIIVFKVNKRIFGHNFLYGPNFALRKSAWEKVKDEVCLEDKQVHEDYDLSIHLGKVGKIGFEPKLKVRTSARRLKGRPPFMVDYLVKWGDTIASHKKYRILQKRFKYKK